MLIRLRYYRGLSGSDRVVRARYYTGLSGPDTTQGWQGWNSVMHYT